MTARKLRCRWFGEICRERRGSKSALYRHEKRCLASPEGRAAVRQIVEAAQRGESVVYCDCIGFDHDPDVQPIFGIEPRSWLLLPIEQRREGHRHLRELANACRNIVEEAEE